MRLNGLLFSEVNGMKSKKAIFPDDRTLKRIQDKLSDPNYQGGELL